MNKRRLAAYRRRKRMRRLVFLTALAFMLIVGLIIVLIFTHGSSSKDSTSSTSEVPTQVQQTQTTQTPAPTTTTSTTTVADDAVDEQYFSDACFIGNSRTEGFMLYCGPQDATYYYHKGLTVDTAFTKSVIKQDGKKTTVENALKNRQFGKVYVMLGVNELGWVYSNIFIDKYGKLIDTIKQTQPNAKIIVQSILPVSQAKSSSHPSINKTRIGEYNTLIQNMCAEKQVAYLPVDEAIQNENGYLPDDATADGVHLNKFYCEKWYDYLKTHTQVPIATTN